MMTEIVKIKSIKKIESTSKRYDIEVEDNHNFFANSILVHNSQMIAAYNFELDKKLISSKGMLKNGFEIEEDINNSYWRGAINDQIFEKIKAEFSEGTIQIFGELVPIQSGYDYGQVKDTIKIFDVRKDNVSIPYDLVPQVFKDQWVPIVFDGSLELIENEVVLYSDPEKGIHKTKKVSSLPADIIKLCEGMELVSGKSKHIREGVVIRPYLDRRASDNTLLRLKIINPKYAKTATGEEIN